MPRRIATKNPPAKWKELRRSGASGAPPPACPLGRYAVVVYWSDEDECFVADLPDFETCSAFGDTPEEALAEVQVAMQLWLETAREHGMLIPRADFGPAVWKWER